MTRLVVGPFNRVEGDLELTLDVEDGVVAAARVGVPLYRGFEQILIGRPVDDALVIAPRVCGICSVSQSLAAAAAIADLSGRVPTPNGRLATALAHASENLADHLTHFYLFFMPDFARDAYAGRPWHPAIAERFRALSGTAAARFLPSRARLLEVMGLIAGKWPHSLAFRPGGTTRALDLGATLRLREILADLRRFAETELFAMPLEAVAGLASLADLDRASDGDGDFARFLRVAADTRLAEIGRGPGLVMSYGAYPGCGADEGPLLPAGVHEVATGRTFPLAVDRVTEDPTHAWIAGEAGSPARAVTRPDVDRADAYSWARAPRLDGRPVEVGALARALVAGAPLARALVAGAGATDPVARVVARLVEVARVLVAMEGWVGRLKRGEPFCAEDHRPSDGAGLGLVEAARGSLGHWLTARGGRITRFQIVAPTTWNFSPTDGAGVRGPLESALVGLELGRDGAASVALQHVVRSFDPCMVCTAH